MNTKYCNKCKQTLDVALFSKNAKKHDGLQSNCKSCCKINSDKHYRENDKQVKYDQKRIRVQALQKYVWDFLQNHPCVDCGESDIVVLEFDHVRGIKKYNVGNMVNSALGLATLQEEIAKCEVRCANCHKRATASRAGWGKYILGCPLAEATLTLNQSSL